MLLLVLYDAKRIVFEPAIKIVLPYFFALVYTLEERVVEELRDVWPISGVLLHAELDEEPVIF